MMVEVFKTSIVDRKLADAVIQYLQEYFPFATINVDIEDCDHVLRIEDKAVSPTDVISLIKEKGYDCEMLV